MSENNSDVVPEIQKLRELEQELEIKNELIAALEDINNEFRNVSEHGQKEREQESLMLKELLDNLDEKSSSNLEEFFSMISHELKTPLVPVQGYVKMLKDGHFGKLEEIQKEKLGIIDSSTNSLINLIQEMLDYQKLSTGKMEMNFQKHSLRKIVDNAFLTLNAEFIQNGITKEISLDENMELMCDEKRLTQVLCHIFNNSLKSVELNTGQIWVEAFISHDQIQIIIRDNGCGILRTELEKIFTKFYQVDMSNTREKGGIGLGLSICKKIVEAHNGKIWAESEIGKGTTINLTLPTKIV